MLEKASKVSVLLGQLFLVLRSIGIDLLEPQDFIFEGFDVEFFAFPMCPAACCQLREEREEAIAKGGLGTGSSRPRRNV